MIGMIMISMSISMLGNVCFLVSAIIVTVIYIQAASPRLSRVTSGQRLLFNIEDVPSESDIPEATVEHASSPVPSFDYSVTPSTGTQSSFTLTLGTPRSLSVKVEI